MNTMDKKTTSISRRKLSLGLASLIALSGCVDIQTNPRGGEENTPSPQRDTPEQIEPATTELPPLEETCTSASVSSFDWIPNTDSEDNFYVSITNMEDVSGEIVVRLTFYEDDDNVFKTGSIERVVSITSQFTQDITIRANPPTLDSRYVTIEVVEQDCFN